MKQAPGLTSSARYALLRGLRYTKARRAKTMPTRIPHDATESTAMTIADCPGVKRFGCRRQSSLLVADPVKKRHRGPDSTVSF